MRKIRFISPYQQEVDAAEHGITFVRGEVVEVPDNVAEALLRSANFEEVPTAAPPATKPDVVKQSIASPSVIAEKNAPPS